MREKKYILNVGLNDKDTKLQKIDSIEAYKIVENTLLNNGLSGYTIYQGKGLYKHDDGTITQENTLIIEMIFTTDDIVNKIIKILKQVLNQESIMKQVQEIELSFEQEDIFMEDYEFKTTFWQDFTIADKFGIKAIKDTYKRAFNEWKDNYIYLTELVLVLNWKIWDWYEKDEEVAKVYNDLWEKTDKYALDNLQENELNYFINTTD